MDRVLTAARQIMLALVVGLIAAPAVMAVEPDEILADPAQELRAREISKGLRCLVCRNESIDESHAKLAKDLRVLVRERLTAGDSNAEVVDYVVDRYGEYVLLRPVTGGSNWLLWGAGPAMLLLAVALGGGFIRRRSRVVQTEPDRLSDEEKARLAKIMEP